MHEAEPRTARRFPHACVASPHYLASSAGAAVLASGGNALDAAIATNLVLGVVTPHLCGYGGDLFTMVWRDGVHAYNGSGRSAAAATLQAVRDATGTAAMPAFGPHTVTVPGAVRGWFDLLDRFGTRSFAELAHPALTYAKEGFPFTPAVAQACERAAAGVYAQDWGAEWRSIYAGMGPVLRQPALARTIAALRDEGPEVYYRGEIAEAIAATVQGHGAFVTAEDLAAHRGDWVEPLATTYRGVEVMQMPPNSQGVAALEALNIVEELDLGAPDSEDREHLLIEATKLVLADRDRLVTDPEHMTIDAAELASKPWAVERRAELDPQRAGAPAPGRPATGGTVYLCAADADGMLVSLIQSNFRGFGSGVTVPGWGINLQNRGSHFSLDPGHANVIAPRKRTMHTLMPALAFRDGRPWLVFGTMGGDGQAQTHLQLLTRVIDDGRDIQEAIDAPRWFVSPADWSVEAESRIAADVLIGLSRRGHAVRGVDAFDGLMGHAHAIEVREDGYAAATDPRAEGAATGY